MWWLILSKDFDWKEYLGLAKTLQAEDTERALRASISRAYYAVFNCCKKYVTANHDYREPTRNHSVHAHLWDFCQTSQNKDLRWLGGKGDKIKNRRHRADYKAKYHGTLKPDCNTTIDEAGAVLERIEKLKQG